MSYKHSRIAVIIPAYNEQESIAKVITDLNELRFAGAPLIDDIVVCDNDSDDATYERSIGAGATVVRESKKGYGAACLRAIDEFRADKMQRPSVVVFVDGDYSVNADEVVDLLAAIEAGADLAVGVRNNHKLQAGAISPHQRFGNWLASSLIRMIWKRSVTDLGPFRAIRYSRLVELDMQDERFGWTVEMQVKTLQAGFQYAEVPVTTWQRIGKSKISGTLRGTIGAAIGIFGKIFELYCQEKEFVESINRGRKLIS